MVRLDGGGSIAECIGSARVGSATVTEESVLHLVLGLKLLPEEKRDLVMFLLAL